MALLTLAAATPAHATKRSIMELPLIERAVLIIKKFETLHRPCHWPAIGYGHMVQPENLIDVAYSLQKGKPTYCSEMT